MEKAKLLDATQAMEYAGITSRTTLYSWEKEGLQVIRKRGAVRWFVEEDELRRFINGLSHISKDRIGHED